MANTSSWNQANKTDVCKSCTEVYNKLQKSYPYYRDGDAEQGSLWCADIDVAVSWAGCSLLFIGQFPYGGVCFLFFLKKKNNERNSFTKLLMHTRSNSSTMFNVSLHF